MNMPARYVGLRDQAKGPCVISTLGVAVKSPSPSSSSTTGGSLEIRANITLNTQARPRATATTGKSPSMFQAAGPCSVHPRRGVKSETSHGNTRKLNGCTTDTMKTPAMKAIRREIRYRCERLLAGTSGVLMAFLLDSQQLP